jgi:hypothetical protein
LTRTEYAELQAMRLVELIEVELLTAETVGRMLSLSIDNLAISVAQMGVVTHFQYSSDKEGTLNGSARASGNMRIWADSFVDCMTPR